MKLIFYIILLLAVPTSSADGRQPDLLNSAYQTHSTDQLRNFFDNWAKEIPPRTEAEINRLPEAEREVYSAYREFYNPRDMKRIGGSEWGDSIYKSIAYCLLQDKITYTFADSISQDGKIANQSKAQLVTDFRPQLNFNSPRALVLNPEYDSLLSRFLENNYSPLGTGNIMAPAAAKGESQKRQAFLQNFIRIWYGHWGGYWQLLTYPAVNKVIFNRSLDRAIVEYRIVYEGGEAFLKKIDGRWRLISGHRTWIE